MRLCQIRRRKNCCLILVCQLPSKFFMSSRRDLFFFCLLIHICCLSAIICFLYVYFLHRNIPAFAFLMCFIIPPHITLSATYFTFCQAHGLLLDFFNSVVNGERSSISCRDAVAVGVGHCWTNNWHLGRTGTRTRSFRCIYVLLFFFKKVIECFTLKDCSDGHT